jgi:hypothetical protein
MIELSVIRNCRSLIARREASGFAVRTEQRNHANSTLSGALRREAQLCDRDAKRPFSPAFRQLHLALSTRYSRRRRIQFP